jgi:hypothetical protein
MVPGDDSHADASAAAGVELLQDFGTFYQAGITTWDAADHYGPAEVLIGRYLQQHPEQRQYIQVNQPVPSQSPQSPLHLSPSPCPHPLPPPAPTSPPKGSQHSRKCTIQGVIVIMWAYRELGSLFN